MGDERARAIESLRRDGARHLKASLASLSRDVAASIRLCSRDFGVLGRELVTALQQRERREHAAARALETERRRRRRLQHQLTGAQGGLRVLCRVRPPLRPDDHPPLPSSHYPHVDSDSPKIKHLRVEVESEQELRICSAVDGTAVKRFCFQRVLDEESTQERVFRDVAPLVHAALDGRHACVFAYGQVGAGKTHSMLGSASDRGVFFRAADMVCAAVAEQSPLATLTLTLQLVEVYNEEVYDLLAPSSTAGTGTGTGAQPPMQFFSPPSSSASSVSVSASTRSAVEIRHGDTGVYLKNVTTVAVDTVDAVYAAIHRGVANRSTNEQSSRSHCVLTLGIVRQSRASGETTVGRLVLVDLAGSERLAKTTTAGLRLREAQYIHKSLSALSDVMAALLAREKHIPFRNSKLTHLLQDSLGGGGDNPALVLVHVSADAADVSETVDTLQFAARITSVQVGGKRPSEHAEITRLNAVVRSWLSAVACGYGLRVCRCVELSEWNGTEWCRSCDVQVTAQSSQLQALHDKLAAELELRKKYEKRLEEYRQDESRRRTREDELKKQHALTPLATSALLSPEQQIAARRWSLYSRKCVELEKALESATCRRLRDLAWTLTSLCVWTTGTASHSRAREASTASRTSRRTSCGAARRWRCFQRRRRRRSTTRRRLCARSGA